MPQPGVKAITGTIAGPLVPVQLRLSFALLSPKWNCAMAKQTFFNELKRRQIYRGGVMYVVAGWVIVQVATQVFPFFQIPDWAIRLVIVAILLGFPLALVALWMFESTLPDEAEARLHDRRENRRDNEAMSQLMANERAERQQQNQQILDALGQIKGHPPQTPVQASTESTPAETVGTMASMKTREGPHRSRPTPAPQKGWRAPTVFFSLFALLILASGVWALVSPSLVSTPGSLQPATASGVLAKEYLVPGISQAQHFGVMLIRPILHKLGIGIDPERVFLVLVVLLGLMVLRSFYREISELRTRRSRRARQG